MPAENAIVGEAGQSQACQPAPGIQVVFPPVQFSQRAEQPHRAEFSRAVVVDEVALLCVDGGGGGRGRVGLNQESHLCNVDNTPGSPASK